MKSRILFVALSGLAALLVAGSGKGAQAACTLPPMDATHLVPGQAISIGGVPYTIRWDDNSAARVCEHFAQSERAFSTRVDGAVTAATKDLREQLDERKTLDYWLHRHPIYGWLLASGLASFIMGLAFKSLFRK